MIVLLSPAKSIDESPVQLNEYSQPRQLDRSEELISVLRKKSVKGLRTLMGISENLAKLNKSRYDDFNLPFSIENSKQAAFAFNGDVYTGLDIENFNKSELAFGQKHIRILSGLYGLLRPLDLIQPYRLEMGTSLKVKRKKNLYDYWNTEITNLINEDLADSKSKYLLNLASIEYFKSVKSDLIQGEVINVDFKEERNGTLKVISFNAKKARGRMAHLIIKGKITNPEKLKDLVVDDYVYDGNLSEERNLLFVKR